MERRPPIFKKPSSVPQDLALIMGFVDLPEREDKAYPHHSVVYREDNNISSSGTESEDEVEAEIVAEDEGRVMCTEPCDVKPADSDSDSESSDSSSSEDDASHTRTKNERNPEKHDEDVDDDGPPSASAYIATVHEISPNTMPIPPLPNPSTLPAEPLHCVGEIINVLRDTVIIRGTNYLSTTERRDAVLDEGSLLLFDDRTPLGHVWETFGPTSLPHYVVRINRKEESILHADPHTHDTLPNPAKLVVSEVVYHIPSLSNFVFSSALARHKGSDASNLHDEEAGDNELEFSDDEAEAAYKKRPRGRSFSRGPSPSPSSRYHDNEDSMSAMGNRDRSFSRGPSQPPFSRYYDNEVSTMDDAQSLYGDSPYHDNNGTTPHSDSKMSFQSKATDLLAMDSEENSEIRRALINARKSRDRRPTISASSSTAHGGRERGRGRGRGRGRDRGRGGYPPMPTYQQNGTPNASFFDNDEYDPRMPRLPSPTSMAIARVTGLWADGSGQKRSPSPPSMPYSQYSQRPAPVSDYVPSQTLLYPVHPSYLDPNSSHPFGQSAASTASRPFNSDAVSQGDPPDVSR